MRTVAMPAPEAAAGDTTPLSRGKTAALTLAQPTVPLRIPLGEGGLTGEKKRMPEAIMGGTKSLTPNSCKASSLPVAASVLNRYALGLKPFTRCYWAPAKAHGLEGLLPFTALQKPWL